jgi:NhaA family Na+:H+ antiporter
VPMNKPKTDPQETPPYLRLPKIPYYQGFVKKIKQLSRKEKTQGYLLFIFSFLALIIANSPLGESFLAFWDTPFNISFGSFKLDKPLIIWINDGLMALFFFAIGLEIKKEILVGELSAPRQVILPVFAAIGGMLLPAGLFYLLHRGQPGIEGWGIPMATDIAFSIGILLMLGKKVPLSFKVFLTAFAIIDDIGAILIIAFFYSHGIEAYYLYAAGGIYLLMWVLNYFDLRFSTYYFILSLIMWYCFLEGGVHPTVAGVLAALAIPVNIQLQMTNFTETIKKELVDFKDANANAVKQFLAKSQLAAIDKIQESIDEVHPPLQRLEYRITPVITFLVLPVFAFANAGVKVVGSLSSPGTLALHLVIALVIGKVVGITLFSWLAIKLKLTTLPQSCTWIQLIGMAFLGGIGFTMSIFIGTLAFSDPGLLAQAKIGILLGSLIAGLIGYFILYFSFRKDAGMVAEE